MDQEDLKRIIDGRMAAAEPALQAELAKPLDLLAQFTVTA
jgi:hypothetical protein